MDEQKITITLEKADAIALYELMKYAALIVSSGAASKIRHQLKYNIS